MNNGPNTLPKARKENLIIKELEEETLVYDLELDRAHCLNSTAGLVWKYCDGKTSVNEIARGLGAQGNPEVDERIVWLALEELEKFHLLENPILRPDHLIGMSRRQLVRNVGFAALAIPVILSIASPAAAQAVSCPTTPCSTPGCIPTGCPCSPNGANVLCAGGNCVGSTGTCN